MFLPHLHRAPSNELLTSLWERLVAWRHKLYIHSRVTPKIWTYLDVSQAIPPKNSQNAVISDKLCDWTTWSRHHLFYLIILCFLPSNHPPPRTLVTKFWTPKPWMQRKIPKKLPKWSWTRSVSTLNFTDWETPRHDTSHLFSFPFVFFKCLHCRSRTHSCEVLAAVVAKLRSISLTPKTPRQSIHNQIDSIQTYTDWIYTQNTLNYKHNLEIPKFNLFVFHNFCYIILEWPQHTKNIPFV